MTQNFSYDPENVFARILRGSIPSHRVYEDRRTVAFMDVMPQGPGHTLIVPRSACRNLLDANPDDLVACITLAQRIARAAILAFKADGITLLQFNEAAGGQSVYHLHFHVIPRFDGVALAPHRGGMESDSVLGEHATLLRAALARPE